jgi:hypothetical protein
MDAATALDTTVAGLEAYPATREAPMRGFWGGREGAAARLPRRHDALTLVPRTRQAAQILEQPAAWGQGRQRGLRHPLLVRAAGMGLTQQEERERRGDPPHGFDGMALFLAAITARRLRRSLGALEAPFGAVVAERGEAGTGTAAVGRADGGAPCVGSTMAAAAAAATPRRVAHAVNDRVGASPRGRRVARRTTKRAGIP